MLRPVQPAPDQREVLGEQRQRSAGAVHRSDLANLTLVWLAAGVKPWLTVLLLCAGTEAVASDKGINAELVEASVTIFCSTSMADDLKPIVERRRRLAISKMSQESLQEEVEENDRLWTAVSSKHRDALGKLGLSARLTSVAPAALEAAAKEAWKAMKEKCPERVKASNGWDFVAESLRRRIPELK